MWTIRELKIRGKAAFKSNYWRSVLVALVLSICVGGLGTVTGHNAYRNTKDTLFSNRQTVSDQLQYDEDILNYLEGIDVDETGLDELDSDVFGLGMNDSDRQMTGTQQAVSALPYRVAVGGASLSFILLILKILILNPASVGCRSFFFKNLAAPESEREIKCGFQNWGRNLGSMLLRDIFLFLWTCLFIIPGIVKAYSYRMVPYILADDPQCDAVDAITRSRKMMNGHKWKTFVLDLSFIGWVILSVVTLGLVGLFWFAPYKYSTEAALYEELK